jgi:threonine dehydrogenase-like Zn-dependent dehydrogenase
MPATAEGSSMGHEFLGTVEDTGRDVTTIKKGDLVIAPFAWSDGTCDFCREGLQTSCRHGGFWNAGDVGGGQAEAVRVPLADGTLVPVPVGEDSPLLPSLLTLSDVYGTGYHAAVKANVSPRTTVTVIGDGAVGLLAVLSAKRLGAERIILMGRHTARTDLSRQFGATDVVAERGEEGIARVRDLTGSDGTHVVLEAVGHMPAYEQSVGVVRPGGVISRVGVPQYDAAAGRLRQPLRAQHHPHRRTRTRPRLHRNPAPGHPQRHRRTRKGLRPRNHSRRGPRRLQGDGRPRSPQSAGPAIARHCDSEKVPPRVGKSHRITFGPLRKPASMNCLTCATGASPGVASAPNSLIRAAADVVIPRLSAVGIDIGLLAPAAAKSSNPPAAVRGLSRSK